MRSVKSAFVFIMLLSLLFGAAHTAAAEDGEEDPEQIEYVFVFDDGTEVRFYSDSELTDGEIEYLACEARKRTDAYDTGSFLSETCYVPDRETAVPEGSSYGFEQVTHPHDHSYVESATVTATKHNVFDDAPKCLECRYKVFTCTVCSAKALGFKSSRRVACHSGTVIKNWEIYDNYLYYNNSDGHKQDGYVTDSVTVKVRPLVTGKPDEGAFPGISRYIKSFYYEENTRTATISFTCGSSSRPDYSTEDIDRYVSHLKYLDALPYIEWMHPATSHDESLTVPARDDPACESGQQDIPPDNPPQNGPASDPPVPGDPTPGVDAQQDGSDATPKSAAPTGKDAPQNGGLHNPQTGDDLILLIAAAVLSAALAVFITIKKHNCNKGENK